MIKALIHVASASALGLFLQSNAWGMDRCEPLQTWRDVPANVRSSLEATVGPIADKGAKFNSTDVIGGGLASNRFLAACRFDGVTAVALERGGRAFRIEVFHYVSDRITKRWTRPISRDGTVSIDLMEPPPAR